MRPLVSVLLLSLAAACASTRTAMPPAGALIGGARTATAPGTSQSVYWTFFSNHATEQLQIAAEPLKTHSHVDDVNGTSGNMLYNTCCVRFYKGFAWILTGPYGSGGSNQLLIFRLPLTTKSTPLYYDYLDEATFGVHMEFDAHGNLWVSFLGYQRGVNTVNEYAGDFFQQNGVLEPSLSLTTGISGPQGLAFDPNGNLYVADGTSNDIAVFAQPIQNSQPYYLQGVTGPGGLAFDGQGNLYAFSNAGSSGALVRYNRGHMRSGDKPNVVDPNGLQNSPYGSDLAFDKAGNLLDADCGNTAGIYTYPLATQKFTSTLSPSFYTNKVILENGCSWNLALH